MSDERALVDAFARAANGHDRDAVIGAAANIILNALRQEHAKLGGAIEELGDLHVKMEALLAARHYDPTGGRRHRGLIMPSLDVLTAALTRAPN